MTKNSGLKRFWRKWYVWSGIAVLLLLLTAGAVLSWFIFSPHPHYKVPALSQTDWAFQSRLLMREMPKLYKYDADRVSRIKLNEAEVNTLLRFAANGINLSALFRGKGNMRQYSDFKATYRDGEFAVYYVPEVAPKLLFGGCVILHLRSKLYYDGRRPELTATAAYAGLLPLPRETTADMLENMLLRYAEEPRMKEYKEALKSIKLLPNGALEITYYPYKLRRALKL